jgi:hypothetical protein
MTKTQTARRLATATDRFRKANATAEVRRADRDRAIEDAYLAGIGASEIADLTGLSRPYVHMLVREVKRQNVA